LKRRNEIHMLCDPSLRDSLVDAAARQGLSLTAYILGCVIAFRGGEPFAEREGREQVQRVEEEVRELAGEVRRVGQNINRLLALEELHRLGRTEISVRLAELPEGTWAGIQEDLTSTLAEVRRLAAQWAPEL